MLLVPTVYKGFHYTMVSTKLFRHALFGFCIALFAVSAALPASDVSSNPDLDSDEEAMILPSDGSQELQSGLKSSSFYTCAEIKLSNPEKPSGQYSITVKGKAFNAFCDMDTDGGGWTLFTTIDGTMESGQWAPFTKPGTFGLAAKSGIQLGSKPADTVQRIRVEGTEWHVDMKTSSPTQEWQLDPCVEGSDISNTLISQQGFSNGLPTGIRVHNNKGSGCTGIGHVYMSGGCSSSCHENRDCKKCDNGQTRLTIKNITPNGAGYQYLATFGGGYGNWASAPRSSLGGYATQCPTANNENYSTHYRCQGFIDQVNWKLISMWYRSSGFEAKAAARTAALKAALDQHAGDYKALFSAMMQQMKSGIESTKIDAVAQLKTITDKRDSAKVILDQKVASTNEKEKAFVAASTSFEAADQSCTSASNTAVAAVATLKSVSATFDARNPVIDKELAVIRQLIDKIGELKALNLQESSDSDHESARSAVVSKTRDMILNLQSFDEEAGPLSEMIELAREHAEFTKPILDLLNQLVSKLLAERDVITKAVSSAKVAHTEAQSASATNCDRREVKRIERCVLCVVTIHLINTVHADLTRAQG